MAYYIGLDIGTTTLSAVAWDAATGELVAQHTMPNRADATPPDKRRRGWAELALDKLQALALQALAQLAAQLGDACRQVGGIGVTGQQHGVALLCRSDGTPLAAAITWQDRRVEEPLAGGKESYLQRFISQAGGPAAFERMGCLPAAGFMGPTLFWLAQQGLLGADMVACFIPDVITSLLTAKPPIADPTNGGSAGIMDIVARRWDWEMIARLGLPRALLPAVAESGTVAGPLSPALARRTGLPAGIPVLVAMGDNQASFLGSVRHPAQSLLLNVGTGAQVSALIAGYHRLPEIETRYFAPGRYLLVGAALFGGHSYAILRDFFRQVGEAFFGAVEDAELYDAMTRLAAAVPPGAEGLRCVPLFGGTRADPSLRASFSGITAHNLTPGHLTRALLEGMAAGLLEFRARMMPLIGPREWLIGAGNAIRRNRLFGEILARAFERPLHIPAPKEAAATGAALLAAVSSGELPTLEAASARLRYLEAIAVGE